ncbi:MAG: hypothetical protein PHS31_03580, partial [Victivallaceae bacterium]|nr:hypothetical protein [Victivallaceae bacterium]
SPPPISIPNGNETVELIADPLNTRHTKTGALHKLEDTRTRKTIKVVPGASKEIAVKQSNVDFEPIADTHTRKTIKVVPEASKDTATREDTHTRKTIKVVPEVSKDTPTREDTHTRKTIKVVPEMGETAIKQEEPEATPDSEDTATAKLERPARKPGAPTLILRPEELAETDEPPVKPTEVGLDAEADDEDTATAKLDRPARKPGAPTLIPQAAASESKSVDASIPKPPVEGAKSSGYSDTRTRRTIKLSPTAAMSSPAPSPDAKTVELSAKPTESGKPDEKRDTRTRKSIKIASGGDAASKPSLVQSAAESAMPTEQAKVILPSSQTIKLRPSGSGSAAPVAAVTTEATPPSSKDTIKLKPAAGSVPSGQKAPASAPGNIPSSAPDAPSGLRIAGAPSAPPTSSATGEASDSQAPEVKNGLVLKKNESARKAPPRAAAEEAALKSGKIKSSASSGPSWAYTSFCVLMLLCLLFTVFVSAAHYLNTWEPELAEKYVSGRIAVPVLDEQIKNR